MQPDSTSALESAQLKLTTTEVQTICDALTALYTSTQPGLQASARALALRIERADLVLLVPPLAAFGPEAHGARRGP